jgi:hypothetical protein
MPAKHRLSTNILRDAEQEVQYYPTPNGQRIVNQLIDDFGKGIRAFNLIGSYGTGKSSFLWALEQSIGKKRPYYQADLFQGSKFDCVKLVGNYQSLIEVFADALQIAEQDHIAEHIFSEILSKYKSQSKKTGLLFILIDEFGKFLEFAAKNNPERELYFIQQLAEFVSNPDYNIVLLTTVHQSFESYATSLSQAQKHEWLKVKGRFRELMFNEPVEQLLFLASEHISSKFSDEIDRDAVDNSYLLFRETRAFSVKEGAGELSLYRKLAPLDPFAAHVITTALQRYGQNERSLFSFLESTDHTSLDKFRNQTPFYGLPMVFDYLNFNLFEFLYSPENPDRLEWRGIRQTLDKIERYCPNETAKQIQLAKTIGLLGIFAAEGARLDNAFLVKYANLSLGIADGQSLIEELQQKHLIFYQGYRSRFKLFEGTDVDIQGELRRASDKVGAITDVASLIRKHYELAPLFAKQHSFATGTPRYFQFVISDGPVSLVPEGEIDGFINLVFTEAIREREIKAASKTQQEAILYGYFKKTGEIKNLLLDIEKALRVLDENQSDKVARRELEGILHHQRQLLNHYILDTLAHGGDSVAWYWSGQLQKFSNKRGLNRLLSSICDRVYADAPIYKNELINRNRISSSSYTAKRNFFKALVEQTDQPELGFDKDRFPAEKTIYYTLIRANGLVDENGYLVSDFPAGSNSSFIGLWNMSVEFLQSAKQERRSLESFVRILQRRPFKLKQGLIDIWIPAFLFIKREEFALFGAQGFIPNLSADTLDLVIKDPAEYFIKSFDIEGIRSEVFNQYRSFLNQETLDAITKKSFIETIKPFLSFYKGLSEYAKQTNQLSAEARSVRMAIATAKDPEQTFFEDLPAALGTSLFQLKEQPELLSEYINKLQAAIREIRGALEGLVKRIEAFIQEELVGEAIPFEAYRLKLQTRFAKLKKQMLLQTQKVFVQRLDSPIDDRQAWLSSLAQALIDKPLERMRDEDEALLYERFKGMMLDLDSLTELSKAVVDEEREEVLGIQLDTFVTGIKRNLVRLPKEKAKQVELHKESLRNSLSDDKALNIAALAKLLTELMNS